jgi:hypothetical protein
MFQNVYHISFRVARHASLLKEKSTCYFIKESSPIGTFLVLYFFL